MDIEELKKALKTDEGQELLNSLIDKAKEPIDAKNKELLAKLAKEKEELSELKTRLSALESEKDEAEQKAAEKSGDVDKIKKSLEEKHKKELEAVTADRDKLNGQLQKHVIGEGLTQALVKANVSKALMPAAKALIQQQFQGEVGDNDGTPFAKFDGKSVDEFVTGWAQSDEGKNFVVANGNSGGGSNGANGQGNAANGQKTISRSDFDALDNASRMAKVKEGVKVVETT